MIQRKQTLFLLAVAVISICLIFVPFIKVSVEQAAYVICLMPGCSAGIVTSAIYVPMSLNFLILLLSIITIFQYKNRALQQKLSMLSAILNIILIALFFVLPYINNTSGITNYTIGSFLPIISAVFAFLAGQFIKKDEELVRSSDRIR